ncbi:MAG: hypothetical protein PVG07_11035 [Acidobacteriota bacterium]|jgi:hypothetical protein
MTPASGDPDLREGAGDGARLADAASLRRIERAGVAWALIAAGALWAAGPVAGAEAGGPLPAAALTAVAAASIVAFRGLQEIVSVLGPASPTPARSDGPRAPEPGAPPESPSQTANDQGPEGKSSGRIGWRQGLAALVRLCLLGALLITGSFLLGPRFFPALVLGFSTLPAALMTEGLLQMVRALRRKDHDGFS